MFKKLLGVAATFSSLFFFYAVYCLIFKENTDLTLFGITVKEMGLVFFVLGITTYLLSSIKRIKKLDIDHQSIEDYALIFIVLGIFLYFETVSLSIGYIFIFLGIKAFHYIFFGAKAGDGSAITFSFVGGILSFIIGLSLLGASYF